MSCCPISIKGKENPIAWALYFSFAVALWPSAVFAGVITGKVVGVIDGDTVIVLDSDNISYKVRLSGIDAPERKQAFGTRSRQHLSQLVFDKSVNIEYEKKDKYGRFVGKVLHATKDVNLAQVAAGMAWHYKHYEKEQSTIDRQEYAAVEEKARKGRIGLWTDSAPVPPWQYRKGQSE